MAYINFFKTYEKIRVLIFAIQLVTTKYLCSITHYLHMTSPTAFVSNLHRENNKSNFTSNKELEERNWVNKCNFVKHTCVVLLYSFSCILRLYLLALCSANCAKGLASFDFFFRFHVPFIFVRVFNIKRKSTVQRVLLNNEVVKLIKNICFLFYLIKMENLVKL